MFRTVLLPTDFSADCPLVWAFAKGLPGMGVHRVVLAHVVDGSGMEGPVIGAKADVARDRLAEIAAGLEDAGLIVELRVPSGDPFRELFGLAAERRIDGVVVGTHGKHLLDQVIRGSVSERLLQEGSKPTLLVRFDLLGAADDPGDLAREFGRRVVMPTDFSGPARHALDLALGLPAGVPERMRLLHVIEDVLSPSRRERIIAGAEFQLDNLVEIAERAGVDAQPSIRSGDPKEETIAELLERDATGVIVGSRGRSPLGEMLLGSVSMKLVREAPCPVLVVH